MPVFTFEKISPPHPRVSASAAPEADKPRSVLVQIIDRFVEPRGKRASADNDQADDKPGQPRQTKTPQ